MTTKLKVYFAGAWKDRADIANKAKLLEKDFDVISTWATREFTIIERTQEEDAGHAKIDVNEVKAADFLLADMTDSNYAYRGTFTEIGVALGQDKPVYIICPHQKSYAKTNVFFHHPSIVVFYTFEEALMYLPTQKM